MKFKVSFAVASKFCFFFCGWAGNLGWFEGEVLEELVRDEIE
jgi:hypothetical protein